nr:hypothetical protein KPHV_20490 [Kitasatospora purpeofusca]
MPEEARDADGATRSAQARDGGRPGTGRGQAGNGAGRGDDRKGDAVGTTWGRGPAVPPGEGMTYSPVGSSNVVGTVHRSAHTGAPEPPNSSCWATVAGRPPAPPKGN